MGQLLPPARGARESVSPLHPAKVTAPCEILQAARSHPTPTMLVARLLRSLELGWDGQTPLEQILEGLKVASLPARPQATIASSC